MGRKALLKKLLQNKPYLELETDLIIKTVCVNYLITCHELNKKLAIVKNQDKYDKEILEKFGYRTLQAKTIDIPTVEFLIDYIFRL